MPIHCAVHVRDDCRVAGAGTECGAAGRTRLLLAGINAITPEIAAIPMSSCWMYWLPSDAAKATLVPIAPTIAPAVFAAYTAPAMRPESRLVEASDASARDMLAPQRIAPGSTTISDRNRSSRKVSHGLALVASAIGQ